MEEISECYPTAYVTDEVYIGDLIEERGYTMNEIARELGRKPHKMFVDIVLRDADSTVAFEYHGEQHYSLVGNMTKNTADLLMNQQLDQEKSWILNRIGIPLVAVPFDMYIDEAVLDNLISEATQECLDGLSGYILCEECNKLFPQSQFTSDGICKGCVEKAQIAEREEEERARKEEAAAVRRERAAERKAARKAEREARGGSSWRTKTTRTRMSYGSEDVDDESAYEGMTPEEEAKARQKAEAKRRRKESQEAWKNSPEYAERKEEEKRRRKEQYNAWKNSPEYAKRKEEEKRRRKEQYEKQKAELKRRGY